jgi:serine O-acetyltransferase
MGTDKRHPYHFRKTLSLIKEDYKAHWNQISLPGFRALAVHRFGEWAFARKRSISRFFFRNIYWFLYRYIRKNYGIEIMHGAKIGRNVRFVHWGGIVVHPAATIGDRCFIRHCVTIGARERKEAGTAPTLKENVEVGVGAVIVGDIVIGENTIIGANTVVRTNVPANAVVKAPRPEIIEQKKKLNKPA